MSPEAATRPPRQEREPRQGTRKATPELFPENFRNSRGKQFPKSFAWPLQNRKKKHILRKFAKVPRLKFQKCFVFEIFAAKISKFSNFFVFDLFFRFFVLDGPSPISKFLCGFQKLQSHSPCCKILGRTNFADILGSQTVKLTE